MISGINGVTPEFYPPEFYSWLYPDLYPDYQDPNQYQNPDLYPDYQDPNQYQDPGLYPNYQDPNQYQDPDLYPGYQDPNQYQDPDLYPDYQDPNQYQDPVPSNELVSEPNSAVSDTPPVEVVSVDDLLNLIQAANEPDPSEEQPTDEAPANPGDTLAVELSPGDLAVVDAIRGVKTELAQISEQLAGMQLSGDHPLLTTSFSDYTVTEGLLLLLLLSVFLSACYKLLRGGFQWLRS